MKESIKKFFLAMTFLFVIIGVSKTDVFAFDQGKIPLNHDWDGTDYGDSEEHLMELEQRAIDNGYASFCEGTSYNSEWTAALKEYDDYFFIWLTADGYSRNLYLEIDRVENFINSSNEEEKKENFQRVIDSRIIINYEIGGFRKPSERGKIFLVADLSQLDNNYDGLSISAIIGTKDPVILNEENHFEASYEVEALETSYSIQDKNLSATDNNGNIYNVFYDTPEVFVQEGKTTTVSLTVTLNNSASLANGGETKEEVEATPTTAPAETDTPAVEETKKNNAVPIVIGCVAVVAVIGVVVVLAKKKKDED